jgi:hypothetical protein
MATAKPVTKAVKNTVNAEQAAETQTHVHEVLGSTKFAETGNDRHNHRFATVSSEVIPIGGGRHVHAVLVNTDFLDHHHEIGGTSGPDIPVGNGKHIHILMGTTTMDDGHTHQFIANSQINSPAV